MNEYLNFLHLELLPTLIVLFPHDDELDMVPVYYAANERIFLNETFPNRCIGRRGVVEWPPRSPDITPLDF